MPTATEFFRRWIVDERTGQRRKTSYKLNWIGPTRKGQPMASHTRTTAIAVARKTASSVHPRDRK